MSKEAPRARVTGSRAIGVFCKEPVPGAVKTRLARDIGAPAAARLYSALLVETFRECAGASAERRTALFAPRSAREAFEKLVPPGLDLFPQSDGDLGDRLSAAFDELLATSRDAVIVGTDCPGLTSARLDEAFVALESSDLVLGPSEDGGYYLIGLREPRATLFQDIPWSTADVLRATRARARGLRIVELATERDIDTLADLRAVSSAAREKGSVSDRILVALERALLEPPASGRKPRQTGGLREE